jgi:hypothetical protein
MYRSCNPTLVVPPSSGDGVSGRKPSFQAGYYGKASLLTIASGVSRVRLLRLLAVMFAVWASLGQAAYAQTTGTIRGVVYDEDGLEVPSVTVRIASPQLIGGQQETNSNEAGEFRFVELLPGVYSITAIKGGFKGVTIEGVQVNINRTTVQNVVMQLGEGEVVDVTTTQSIDTESTSVGQVLTRDFLSRIPTGRSYQQAVQVAQGVSGGSNPNMAGGGSNENTYMLDGATVTDPVTGTFGNNFNYDAIQQIEVILGGYEPEYGNSLGGIINLVTLSGTNNLEFNTSVYYQNGDWRPRKDERLTSDGFRLGPTGFDSTFQILQVAARVSGPLVRDKAWFVFSYQHDRSLIANSGIQQVQDYDGHYILAKLTVQPNSSHRLSLLFQSDPATIDNWSQSNQFQKAESQPRQAQSGFLAQARWQWFLNEKMNLDTRFNVQKISIEVNATPCTHNRDINWHPCHPDEEEGEVDYFTPGRSGILGAYDSVNWTYFNFSDRWRFTGSTKFAILAVEDPMGGTHDVKVGIEGNQFINNNLIGYSGNTIYVDRNLANFDPETFTNFYFIEASQPLVQRNTGSTWNFFLQDAYKPISNLTIKYGLRFDRSVLRNDIGDPVIRGALWGPRFFAAWDPFGDQKTKIAGGWGRFNDAGRQELASYTSVGAFGFKLYYGEVLGQEGVIAHQSQMGDIAPRNNVNISWDKLRMPSVDEFILIFQRQLVPDVTIGANLSARFTRHIYEADEVNVIYDEDGSAVIGSRRSNPLVNYERLRTPREARRNYYRVDLTLAKNRSRRWAGQLNYSYTFMNSTSPEALWGSFLNDPQTRYNYGQPTTYIPHTLTGWVYWILPTDPWAISLSAVVRYESGEALERRYWTDPDVTNGYYDLRVRPRGIYTRFNDVWYASFGYRQEFDVRKGKIVLSADLMNAFNNQAPFGVQTASLYQENRLMASSRQTPLRLQIGLVYEF